MKKQAVTVVKSYIDGLISTDDEQVGTNEKHVNLVESDASVQPEDIQVAAKKAKISVDRFGYSFTNQNAASRNVPYNWEQQFDAHLSNCFFTDSDMDGLTYWKAQLPSPLQRVAVQILSVTASSAPVERMFSVSGNNCTPSRSRIKGDLLSAIVKAKYNK